VLELVLFADPVSVMFETMLLLELLEDAPDSERMA
jgi:hypothetical protein